MYRVCTIYAQYTADLPSDSTGEGVVDLVNPPYCIDWTEEVVMGRFRRFGLGDVIKTVFWRSLSYSKMIGAHQAARGILEPSTTHSQFRLKFIYDVRSWGNILRLPSTIRLES